MRGVLIVICVSGLTGLTLPRCKSAPTPKQTVEAQNDADILGRWIEDSDVPPTVKNAARAKVENIKTVLQKQGETITEQATQISTLEKYRAYVWAFVAGVAAILTGLAVIWWLRK